MYALLPSKISSLKYVQKDGDVWETRQVGWWLWYFFSLFHLCIIFLPLMYPLLRCVYNLLHLMTKSLQWSQLPSSIVLSSSIENQCSWKDVRHWILRTISGFVLRLSKNFSIGFNANIGHFDKNVVSSIKVFVNTGKSRPQSITLFTNQYHFIY